MTDTELLSAMLADFHDRYRNHKKIQNLLDSIEKGTASYADAREYAVEVSKLIGCSWHEHYTQIADDGQAKALSGKLLPSVMDENYEKVAAYTAQTQKALNRKARIGLKVQIPSKNTDRIAGLGKMVENAKSYETAEPALLAGMENFSQNIVDESVRLNADLHSKAGLRPKITRQALGGCCDWCKALAGTYSYPNVPKDVFRRHANCNCLVTYDPADGTKQDVWSKARWAGDDPSARIAAIKQLGEQRKQKAASKEKARKERSEWVRMLMWDRRMTAKQASIYYNMHILPSKGA